MTTAPIPFDPARFRSAATHYLRGRPDYAPGLIRDVATLCGLDGTGRLLDLGCGPGQLAIAFRPFVAEALGMDPEPEMLALAERRAAEAGVAVAFRQGSSYDLAELGGVLRVATIGRAYHWMDRPATARQFDAMLEPGGALVLFQVDHPDVPDNAWQAEFKSVLSAAVAGGERSVWRQPGWLRHEAILLDSPFPVLHRVGVVQRRAVPVDDLVQRALSMSRTTRARLGEAGVAKIVDAVNDLAGRTATDGMITEVVESVALIARRPGRSPSP